MRGFVCSKRGLCMILGLFVLLIFMAPQLAQAECCGSCGEKCYCPDGKGAGTDFCCGVGSCNIFCCNCKGGCKQDRDRKQCYQDCFGKYSLCSNACDINCMGSESCEIMCENKCVSDENQCKANCDKKYPTSPNANKDAFRKFGAHDKDNSGQLSKDEFNSMVDSEHQGRSDLKDHFNTMDKNKDGHVSLEEAGIKMPHPGVKPKSCPKCLMTPQGKSMTAPQKKK